MRAFRATPTQLSAGAVPPDDPRWREFVLGHDRALPYHHPAWTEVITDTYGFEPFGLVARSPADEILGGVPFVTVGGRLRRKRWVALPFTDVCPPLTRPELSTEDLGTLVVDAQRRAGVGAVEIRAPVGSALGTETSRGVSHTLTLSNPDDLFTAFESQVRRNIRKAERAGLSLRLAEQPQDLSRVYFTLHAETRRRLGVPTQPRRFFEAIWKRMVEPGLAFVLLAFQRDTPVAGAVFLEWNARIVYKFGASDPRHWPLRPNNLIFWEAIRRGCDSEAQVLDFGRTDLEDEGLRAFKRSWGAVEDTLLYTTFGKKAHAATGSAERLFRPVLRHAPTWVGRGLGEVFYRFSA